MKKDLETVGLQSSYGSLQQIVILEGAAAQAHTIQLLLLPDSLADFGDDPRNGVMKTRRHESSFAP